MRRPECTIERGQAQAVGPAGPSHQQKGARQRRPRLARPTRTGSKHRPGWVSPSMIHPSFGANLAAFCSALPHARTHQVEGGPSWCPPTRSPSSAWRLRQHPCPSEPRPGCHLRRVRAQHGLQRGAGLSPQPCAPSCSVTLWCITDGPNVHLGARNRMMVHTVPAQQDVLSPPPSGWSSAPETHCWEV